MMCRGDFKVGNLQDQRSIHRKGGVVERAFVCVYAAAVGTSPESIRVKQSSFIQRDEDAYQI
jgi:hypothetical protein